MHGGEAQVELGQLMPGSVAVMIHTAPDGTQMPAELVGTDPETDIALLKVEAAAQLTRLGDAQGLKYLSDMLDGKRKDTRGHAISVAGTLQIEPLYGQVARIAQNADDPSDQNGPHSSIQFCRG